LYPSDHKSGDNERQRACAAAIKILFISFLPTFAIRLISFEIVFRHGKRDDAAIGPDLYPTKAKKQKKQKFQDKLKIIPV
jgi:hypothetical protein